MDSNVVPVPKLSLRQGIIMPSMLQIAIYDESSTLRIVRRALGVDAAALEPVDEDFVSDHP